MASFKSKVINSLMRNRHLFQGKLKRDVFDMDTSIKDFRDLCEKGAARMAKLPEGVKVKQETIDGINSEIIIPAGCPDDKIIMYVHGGGYVSGSCNDHRAVVAKFAEYNKIKAVQYEYGLAPEKPFPAGLNDSVTIYKHLLETDYKPCNIVIAGESAGGGLTLALLLALKERGLPQPAAAVAISPWTDLTCSSDSYKTKHKVSVAPLNSWTVFSKHYCGDNSPQNPLISPLFGDLVGLPPLFIVSGMDDELYDDGEKFYKKAKESGVDAHFIGGEGMVHCYPILAPMFKEATEAMSEICKFIAKHIHKNELVNPV